MTDRRYATALAAPALLSLCLGMSACHPKKLSDVVGAGAHISTSDTLDRPIRVAQSLDCPQNEGELRLRSAAPDGRSCAYASDTGVVELTLIEDAADPAAALAPFRARVDAAMPRQAHGANATVSVTSDRSEDGGKVDRVDMPFLHVSDDGKHAHVRLFGMSIDAESHHRRHHDDDDDDDDDDVGNTGGAGQNTVAAAANGREDVYLLAGDPATREGYHAVGYVARGDGQGRMVVALFKSRNGDSDNHNHDLDALLDLNARKG